MAVSFIKKMNSSPSKKCKDCICAESDSNEFSLKALKVADTQPEIYQLVLLSKSQFYVDNLRRELFDQKLKFRKIFQYDLPPLSLKLGKFFIWRSHITAMLLGLRLMGLRLLDQLGLELGLLLSAERAVVQWRPCAQLEISF